MKNKTCLKYISELSVLKGGIYRDSLQTKHILKEMWC